jgi:hypothetical protein
MMDSINNGTQSVQTIDATTPIPVTLQAVQWNQAIALMTEGPYRVAAPLIQEIAKQTQAYVGRLPMQRGNGELAAEIAHDPNQVG